MSKKAFTLIELITTFALSAVIIIFLLNVVISIRNIYFKTNIKSDLYIIQSNLSNNLNKSFGEDNIMAYEECYSGTFCYDFTLINGSVKRLLVDGKSIKFGDLEYTLNDAAEVSNPEIITRNYIGNGSGYYDSFLLIKIPIVCSLYPGVDFGINLVYQYNSNVVDL